MFSKQKGPVDLEELINNNDINAIRQTKDIEYLMSKESSKGSLNYFLLSCYQGKYEIVKLFDNLNVFIRESVDIRGNFCYHLCCCMNNEDSCKIIDYFVGKYGIDVLNKRNTSGLDVFSFCCVNNLSYVVCHLLEHYRDSINIESRDNTFQKRPINLCLATDSFECYSKLVDFGSALSQSSEFPNNKETQYKDYYDTHLNSRGNMENYQTSAKPSRSRQRRVRGGGKSTKKTQETKINYEEEYNKLLAQFQKSQEESNKQINYLQNQLKTLNEGYIKTNRKISRENKKQKSEIHGLKNSLNDEKACVCQLQDFLKQYEDNNKNLKESNRELEERNRELEERDRELEESNIDLEKRYNFYKRKYNDLKNKEHRSDIATQTHALRQEQSQRTSSRSRHHQSDKGEEQEIPIFIESKETPKVSKSPHKRSKHASPVVSAPPKEADFNPPQKSRLRRRRVVKNDE